MITPFTLAQIVWTLNVALIPGCDVFGPVDGCYIPATKTIYVGQDTLSPPDFILYHETAHHMFAEDFDKKLFANKEIMADQFALYMYIQKYPSLKKLQSKKRYTYFSKQCNKVCTKEILSVEVSGIKFPLDFRVRN